MIKVIGLSLALVLSVNTQAAKLESIDAASSIGLMAVCSTVLTGKRKLYVAASSEIIKQADSDGLDLVKIKNSALTFAELFVTLEDAAILDHCFEIDAAVNILSGVSYD